MAGIADLTHRRAMRTWVALERAHARASRYVSQSRAFAAEGATALLDRFHPTTDALADLRMSIHASMARSRYDEGDVALLAGVELDAASSFLAGSDVVDPYDALRLAMITGVDVPFTARP